MIAGFELCRQHRREPSVQALSLAFHNTHVMHGLRRVDGGCGVVSHGSSLTQGCSTYVCVVLCGVVCAMRCVVRD